MNIRVALFGIHKLLSSSLENLEQKRLLPAVVFFPPGDSDFHQSAIQICLRNHIPYKQVQSVKTAEFLTYFRSFGAERIVVTGYNEIFPAALISDLPLGAINCHGGLLPQERGPVPWKWAIYEGRKITGVTYHEMTGKVDQGRILIRNQILVSVQETAASLFDKLAADISNTAPRLFTETEIADFDPQLHRDEPAGYRGQVPAELTVLDLSLPVAELDRRVRAFSPRPGVFLDQDGKRFLVTQTTAVRDTAGHEGWVLKAADGYIAITGHEIL